jgi:hypothetical protein
MAVKILNTIIIMHLHGHYRHKTKLYLDTVIIKHTGELESILSGNLTNLITLMCCVVTQQHQTIQNFINHQSDASVKSKDILCTGCT